jgi:hypothetical protein
MKHPVVFVSRRKRVAQMHDWWCCWLWTPAGAHVTSGILAFLQWHIKATSRAANWNFNANSRNRLLNELGLNFTFETGTCHALDKIRTTNNDVLHLQVDFNYSWYAKCKIILEVSFQFVIWFCDFQQNILFCWESKQVDVGLCNRLCISG